jgi:hypothetical protein
MTLHVLEPKKASHSQKQRLPLLAGAACILAAYLLSMVVIESGFGADQTTVAPHKTPGQYFKAVLLSGHLSITTASLVMGILLTGILVGLVGITWRSST